MNAKWEKLIALLSEMVDLYQAILELSRQKRELLIAVKPQDLEAVTKQEELLILQVGKLESARTRLTKDIAVASGRPPAALTLSELKELAGPAEAERLETVAGEFDRIMQELAPINQLNAELIQRALGFINYNLNLLTQSAVSPTYAADGRNPQENHQRKLVDRKI